MESIRFAVVTPKGGPKGEEDAVGQKKKKKKSLGKTQRCQLPILQVVPFKKMGDVCYVQNLHLNQIRMIVWCEEINWRGNS